ncbi:hypothetical protein PHYSODRAFT_347976 [Phytophthora sojae]|uniref:Uncharacterized protein n=1 Tax=Phytophthora sojae (strain P6497) TaxID=1094619 RepID=G5A6P7_PHYSP|nr:hypothetical protein PHYSODRAFT_347976 [Phytophthora sojae]EGZ09002.1 hypothetical protein PHYSODRAFT_347976 [Phytophthora sojae]|eukprot:XP_009535635.1 hypothetical protein PHYSODRAFT_347976 [Phytophthora sojae]
MPSVPEVPPRHCEAHHPSKIPLRSGPRVSTFETTRPTAHYFSPAATAGGRPQALIVAHAELERVTAEYYRPFRVGLKEPEFMTSDMRFIGSEVQAQRSFVRAVIAPDVLYGTVQGVDALLENWRYLSLGFKGAVAVMNAVLDWPAGFLPDKKSPSVKT